MIKSCSQDVRKNKSRRMMQRKYGGCRGCHDLNGFTFGLWKTAAVEVAVVVVFVVVTSGKVRWMISQSNGIPRDE